MLFHFIENFFIRIVLFNCICTMLVKTLIVNMKNVTLRLFIALLSVLFCFAGRSQKKVTIPAPLTEALWKNLPTHPRLFANRARIEKLKLQNDEVTKDLFLLLKNNAEKTLQAPRIVYPTTGFKFGAVRNVQGRLFTLGLAYRLFGDSRYLERAKSELLQLADLPDWCPSHFLDVGEATLAAGVGLDWLYDELTEAEREKVVKSIINNGLIPSLDAKPSDNNSSWLNGNFNWNPVCNGGLLVGALAIYEKEPALSRKIVERSVKYLPYAGAAYAPDGTYAEGPGYWSYGTTFHVIMVEALRTVFGTTLNLEKFPGFLKTTDFITQVVGPTGHDYPFSDAGSHARSTPVVRYTSEPVMMWFAREKRETEVAREELNSFVIARDALRNDTSAKAQRYQSRHFALEVLWWDPSLPPLGKTIKQPRHWTAGGHLPLAVMRSAWGDPLASFVAVKGGTPNNSHGHMDVGSFILEANGVRWAHDLGGESYDKMRAAKLDLWNYSQNSNRWTTFRPGPEAHNILRFNNARQDVSGFGTINKAEDKGDVMGNVVNLTSLYRSQTKSVTRTIKLHPDRSITIEDSWTTGPDAVEATFQWITEAKATVQDNGVLLEQAGKRLKLVASVPGTGIRPAIVVEDVSKAKNPQDSDNPGISRILFKVNTPASNKSGIQIKAVPQE